MSLKSILSNIGLGAVTAGGLAVEATVPGAGALVQPLLGAIADKLDPAVKDKFDLAVSQAQLQIQQLANEHDEKMQNAVNATMQAEAAARSDGWRKAWGYASCGCFVFMVVIEIYAALHNPALTTVVVQLGATLMPYFTMATAILGITAGHDWHVDAINAKSATKN